MSNRTVAVSLLLFAFASSALSTTGSMSLSDGYVLCGAYSGSSTVLIDKNGTIVKTWDHNTLPDSLNGYSVYLLENGNLLRTSQVNPDETPIPPGAGPIQGIVAEIDPSGSVVWSYQLANDTFLLHHDIKPMPNGNFLAVAFETRTIAEAKQVGVDTALFPKRNPKVLLSERIIEVNPRAAKGKEIVWQWLLWDHVTPKSQAAEHWELFNGSAGTPASTQWVHLNGLAYCPRRNLIVFTSRLLSELFVIDHGTTTQEAAAHTGGSRGKGGDFLYRWGNPANYDSTASAFVHVLHCPTWIPDNYPGGGNILFFHNNMTGGFISTGSSQVIEIKPPVDATGAFIKTPGVPFGPEAPTWMYNPGEDFSSMAMSSAFRLANGNTLIHEAFPPSPPDTSEGRGGGFSFSSNSRLREVTPDQKILWEYLIQLNSGNQTGMGFAFTPAKIMYYPSNYAGITNLFLKINSNRFHAGANSALSRLRQYRRGDLLCIDNGAGSEISLVTLQGKQVASLRPSTDRFTYETNRLPAGLYIVKATSQKGVMASWTMNVSR